IDADVTDVRIAAAQSVDFARIGVEADHFKSALLEEQQKRQADVAQTDDTHARASRTDPFEKAVQHLRRSFNIRLHFDHSNSPRFDFSLRRIDDDSGLVDRARGLLVSEGFPRSTAREAIRIARWYMKEV